MELDAVEKLGQQYYTLTGQYLEYEKYLYLIRHSGVAVDLMTLLSPEVLIEAERLRQSFHQEYYASGFLTGEKLMPEGMNVMAERLSRYVTIPEHRHDFIEIACVLSGECRHIVEGVEYIQKPGTLGYINPGARHQLIAMGDAVCVTLKVRQDWFVGLNLPFVLDFITPVMYACGDDPAFPNLVNGLLSQSADKAYRGEICGHLFTALMLYMGQNYRQSMTRMYHARTGDKRIIAILDYMVENYRTVTLRSTAAHFHYTEPYLSRLFREKTGETFTARLRDFKLEMAARLLRETNKKLDAICEEIGYADVTQFIHSFKQRFQTTPIQYRKKERLITG